MFYDAVMQSGRGDFESHLRRKKNGKWTGRNVKEKGEIKLIFPVTYGSDLS
jgi:hypothetical protein